MRNIIFFVLVGISAVVLIIFIGEGKQDKQGLDAVMEIPAKTVRDIVETASSPLDVPVRKEVEIGEQVLRQYFPSFYTNNLVQQIGRRLAEHARRNNELTYRFYAYPATIVNAFALPGGLVVVTEGMLGLVENEDELAWVMAHEISHVEYKHALAGLRLELARQKLHVKNIPGIDVLSRMAEHLLRVGYSETMELEADRGGVSLMRRADYNPRGALTLVNYMLEKEQHKVQHITRNPLLLGVRLSADAIRDYFGTHPNWVRRKQVILDELRKM